MKHGIRSAALALCFALLFTITACSKGAAKPGSSTASGAALGATVTPAGGPGSFSLAVTLDKSLDPLTTDSMNNLVLWPLMYDSLAEPNQSYAPVLGLASSVDSSGSTVTVHLKGNVKFSDGTPLTSNDVEASYNLVLGTPASFFYANVADIQSVQASGPLTVIFHLKAPDVLFSNLLDVPIIKSGTDANNSSYRVTGINVPPTGSGKYVFSSDSFSGLLSVNTKWYGGTAPTFKAIKLVNMLNGSSTFSSLKVGEINFMFSDYGNGALPAVNLDTTSFSINRMVYMGVNSVYNPALSIEAVRNAISIALNRDAIATNVFSSKAAATDLPFDPNWSGLQRPGDSYLSPGITEAQGKLADAGFTVPGSNGAMTGLAGGATISLSFRLLVDSGDSTLLAAAKEIVNDLSVVGVVVTLDAEPQAAYDAALTQGNFDLYLGQINVANDMDLSAFFGTGGSASYGIPAQTGAAAAFTAWHTGAGSINAVVSAFRTETPFIPLCYRYGSVSYTKGLESYMTPTYYDVFLNMGTWHY